MRRLLGLIGLTYLSALTVVFYFPDKKLRIILAAAGIISAILSLAVFILTKRTEAALFMSAALACSCAVISVSVYENSAVNPIKSYDGKEIFATGYICEEPENYESYIQYIMQTEKINGQNLSVKILIYSYKKLGISEFDRLKANISVSFTDSNVNNSDGIFLISYAHDNFSITKTGAKQASLYIHAINIRKKLKSVIDSMLPKDEGALCKAIALGDKKALPNNIYADFLSTGTSFLIVVSGMHLSVAVSFLYFIFKKLLRNKWLICIALSVSVIIFAAITGANRSVIRAAIMVITSFGARAIFDRYDGITALGLAALIMTLPNPYAVGDIGMLFSFSATMGILLWESPMSMFIIRKCKLYKLKPYWLKVGVLEIIQLFSASTAAALWVLPITVFFFGRINPIVVVVSILSQSAVSMILILTMIFSVLALIPFIGFLAYPTALAAGILCKYVIFIISSFAQIPFCSVYSDKNYVYIWIIISVILVIIGYLFFKGTKFYVPLCAVASAFALAVGWSVSVLYTDNSARLLIYNSGKGLTAAVSQGNQLSIISCGGSVNKLSTVRDGIIKNHTTIDNIVIPKSTFRYSSLLPFISDDYTIENLAVFIRDGKEEREDFDGISVTCHDFYNGESFALTFNSNIIDKVLNISSVTYQYIKVGEQTILFAPSGADFSKLPSEMRRADYLLIEDVPKNSYLIESENVLFIGTNYKKYQEELTGQFYNLTEVKGFYSLVINR